MLAGSEDIEELGIAEGTADVLGRTAAGCVEKKRVVEPRDAGFDLLDLDRARPCLAEIVEVLQRERLAVLDRAAEARMAGIDAVMVPVGIGDTVLNPAELNS